MVFDVAVHFFWEFVVVCEPEATISYYVPAYVPPVGVAGVERFVCPVSGTSRRIPSRRAIPAR